MPTLETYKPQPTTGQRNREVAGLNNSVTAVETTTDKTIDGIRFNNSANTATTYLHGWDVAAGSVVLGTTEAHFIYPCPKQKTAGVHFPGGGLDVWAVVISSAALTASKGTSSPSGNFDAHFLTDD